MSGFPDIADRLSKLIPRLGSNHSGEIAATVAAIERTLAGVGLDWHDLARRVATPTVADVASTTRRWSQPEPEPTTTPTGPQKPPGFSDADWERWRRRAEREASTPKREVPPWPTWGGLSHFGRLAMLEEIRRGARFAAAEAERFEAAARAYHGQQIPPSRKNINLFNAASRDLWERGWRPEEMAA